MAERSTSHTTTTTVRHIAKPLGRERGNPPHLGDLRAFVEMCEGLPDELGVFIKNGPLNEAGRYDTTFTVRYNHPVPEEPDA